MGFFVQLKTAGREAEAPPGGMQKCYLYFAFRRLLFPGIAVDPAAVPVGLVADDALDLLHHGIAVIGDQAGVVEGVYQSV